MISKKIRSFGEGMGYSRINSNRVSKRSETVTSVEALEALREKTSIWKLRSKSESHAAKFRLVGNGVMYVSG